MYYVEHQLRVTNLLLISTLLLQIQTVALVILPVELLTTVCHALVRIIIYISKEGNSS